MVLNSTNRDIGEANDEIEVAYDGSEIEVAYNVNYLINAIDVIDEEEIIFEIGGHKRPGIIRGVGNDRYKCIVMPLRI